MQLKKQTKAIEDTAEKKTKAIEGRVKKTNFRHRPKTNH